MYSKISDKINTHFSRSEWGKARFLILTELKKDSNNHWLLTRLSSTYYEEYNYKKAVEISKKAMKMNPQCPLVLWDYACGLDMIGKHKMAISIWKKLLKYGTKKIAFSECGEGIRWARAVLNDCRYRIGLSYLKLKNTTIAIRYIKSHLINRKPGISSIFPLSEVKNKFKAIKSKRKVRMLSMRGSNLQNSIIEDSARQGRKNRWQGN